MNDGAYLYGSGEDDIPILFETHLTTLPLKDNLECLMGIGGKYDTKLKTNKLLCLFILRSRWVSDLGFLYFFVLVFPDPDPPILYPSGSYTL